MSAYVVMHQRKIEEVAAEKHAARQKLRLGCY